MNQKYASYFNIGHQLGLVGFRAYFANPKFNKRRHTLTADLWDQWSKGNRGQKGMWL